VGVDPDDAAFRMIEASQNAVGSYARAGKHDWERVGGNCLSHRGRNLPVDAGRRIRGVSKGSSMLGDLDGHPMPLVLEQSHRPGVDEAARSRARRVALVTGVRGDLDHADVQIASRPFLDPHIAPGSL
jgi:hypothetical protein